MREIKLTQGKVALVDDADFDWLSKGSWHFNNGYAMGRPSGGDVPAVPMHRVILDAQKGQQVDHANHDRLDNRRINIRTCTPTENSMNSDQCRVKNKASKYRGVSLDKRKTGKRCWVARAAGRYLGSFFTEIEAARAYDQEIKRRFPKFGWVNFPMGDISCLV